MATTTAGRTAPKKPAAAEQEARLRDLVDDRWFTLTIKTISDHTEVINKRFMKLYDAPVKMALLLVHGLDGIPDRGEASPGSGFDAARARYDAELEMLERFEADMNEHVTKAIKDFAVQVLAAREASKAERTVAA